MRRILSFLIIIALFGCSSNPSENDGRTVALNLIKKTNSEKYLKLNSFKKINAIETEVFGQKNYTIDYEVEIEILRRTVYLSGFQASEPPIISILRPVEAGYIKTFKGSFLFQKTENGWLGQDCEIY